MGFNAARAIPDAVELEVSLLVGRWKSQTVGVQSSYSRLFLDGETLAHDA